MNGWIGVDLDGTLAEYNGWVSSTHIGAPIPSMVERVKAWIAEGKNVMIFTARAWPLGTASEGCYPERDADSMKAVRAIQAWSEANLGRILGVTCVKDYGMIELWDDRAVQVEPNTGRRMDGLK